MSLQTAVNFFRAQPSQVNCRGLHKALRDSALESAEKEISAVRKTLEKPEVLVGFQSHYCNYPELVAGQFANRCWGNARLLAEAAEIAAGVRQGGAREEYIERLKEIVRVRKPDGFIDARLLHWSLDFLVGLGVRPRNLVRCGVNASASIGSAVS